jgi:hypothetical protein
VLTITHGTLPKHRRVVAQRQDRPPSAKNPASFRKRAHHRRHRQIRDAPALLIAIPHSMLDTINEGTLAVTSMVHTQDVLNTTDVDLYRELAGGVTTLNLLHGSANPIGGLNTVVKIKYGRPASEFLFPGAMPGIKFALGENVKQSSRPNLPGVRAVIQTRAWALKK